MATSREYIEFVCDQLRGDHAVSYKKMFGEYMIYLGDRPALLVCDSTVFVKQYDELSDLLSDAERSVPYPGAKEHYILDVEDREKTEQVLKILEKVVPPPKPKRRKEPKA